MVNLRDIVFSSGGIALSSPEPRVDSGNFLDVAVQGAGNLLEQKKERDTDNFLNNNFYEFQNQQIERFEQMKLDVEDTDQFSEKYIEQFKATADATIKNAGGFVDQEVVKQRFNQLQNRFSLSAIEYEATERTKQNTLSMEKAANDIINGALITGDYAAAEAELEELALRSENKTTPTQLQRFKQEQKNILTKSRIIQEIQSRPDQVDELLTKYSDNLDPQDVVSLQRSAEAQVKANQAAYEKALNQRQEENRSALFAQILDDPTSVTDAQLGEMLKTNQLDTGDVSSLISIRQKVDDTPDDLYTLSQMNVDFANGDLNSQQIIKLHAAGKISRSTAEKYIPMVTAKITNTPAVKDAIDLIENSYNLDINPDDELLFLNDKAELQQRVLDANNPENPVTVAKEIAERNEERSRIRRQKRRDLRDFRKNNPDIKTKEDVAKAKTRLVDALKKKNMTKEEARRQFELLQELEQDL